MNAWIPLALLSIVLVTSAATDLRTGKVYNIVTYPAILLGLALGAIQGAMLGTWGGGWIGGLSASMLGLAAGFFPFLLIFAAGGLGGGDVKLMAAVGAISGRWECVLSTAVYALALGALFSVAIIIRRGLVRQTAQRLFGAVLSAGARVAPEFPPDSPRIPFALAIAIGGIVAGLEVLIGVHTPWSAFS